MNSRKLRSKSKSRSHRETSDSEIEEGAAAKADGPVWGDDQLVVNAEKFKAMVEQPTGNFNF